MIGVYGANGFIGRHLVRRLAHAGLPVRAVSRRLDESFVRDSEPWVDFQAADLNDPLAMAASLHDIDTVVQLISTSSPGLRNDHMVADIEENVVPHVRFLRECLQAGVRRFVFISSGGTVYGPGAITPTPESAPTNPICSHGLTKLFIEKYIEMHSHVDGLEYVILRLANPFGPGQEFHKGQGLIPSILDRHRRGLPVRIYGGGAARRDYIFIDDVVDAIHSAVRLEGSPRLVLNIASGETRTILEVIKTIEAVSGIVFAREYVEARKTDVDVSSLDIRQACERLHWRSRVPFRDGIARTLQSYRRSLRS
jgi:UDP-glucose 4-epimerase